MLPFAKYHGLGNDFVIVDLRAPGLDPDDVAAIQTPAIAAAICDRAFGVGADGVLALLPGRTRGAIATMRVLNADGSEAEMCGNGIRCVGKYLRERGGADGDVILVDTGAGPLRCELHGEGGAIHSVTVDMGRPRLARAEIPMTGPDAERAIDVLIEVLGHAPRRFIGVSMGNPHAITFVEPGDGADLRTLATTVGPTIEHLALFPRRTNVEYARMRSRTEIDLFVWERGSGLTLACGTGACATATAACLTGRADVGSEIKVNLPGGPMWITVAEGYATALMRGPAQHVFDGTLAPRAVAPRP